jgi:hypothetical protein
VLGMPWRGRAGWPAGQRSGRWTMRRCPVPCRLCVRWLRRPRSSAPTPPGTVCAGSGSS